jgi:hypothetical protein
VEAVVLRYSRTGRLCAVNTSAFLWYDGSTHTPRAKIGDLPREIQNIEPQRGDILETPLELAGQKLKSENEIAKVRGRDSRRTLIDRKLLY